jgi:hypothetical protein
MTFYLRGNIFEGEDRLTADNSLFFEGSEVNGGTQLQIAATPFLVSSVHTLTAQEAYEAVLYTVGASLPARDSVDARIVDEVRTRRGSIIDSQMQVGGWPEYATSQVRDDRDDDGMPDEWEVSHGLNPHNPKDASLDRDADGYTNIEEYINNTPKALTLHVGSDNQN